MTETILPAKPDAEITDTRGRKIVVREMGFKDRHRLFRAVGKQATGNEAFLADCMMFASVISVDGVPVPPVSDKNDVEPIMDVLGDDGCEAVQTWFAARADAQPLAEVVADAKN